MKTLQLICDCGAKAEFRGPDAKSVLAAIDAAGWHDYPDTDRPLPKGQQHGDCPQCSAEAGVA